MGNGKRLRPLGTADLLDETVELYKSNFVLILGISALVNAPIGLLSVIQSLHMYLALLGFPLLLAMAAFTPVFTAAVIFAISDRYFNRPTTIEACYRRAFSGSIYWNMLGIGILQGVAVAACMMVAAAPAMVVVVVMMIGSRQPTFPSTAMAAMIAFMLVGALATAPLWVRLMLAGPAMVVERQGASSALGRSWTLIKGSVFRSTLVIVIAYVVVNTVPSVLGGLLAPLTGHANYYDVPVLYRVTEQGIVLLARVMLAPLLVIAETLLYFDLRVRKEGLDLQLMAGEMESR